MTEARMLSHSLQVARRTASAPDLKREEEEATSPDSLRTFSSFSSFSSSSSLSNSSSSGCTSPKSTKSNLLLSKAQLQEQEKAFLATLFQQLLQQLQFYLSPDNLRTDTYLQTLQRLNDGCVPVHILANFAKIKALLWATPALTKRFASDKARMLMLRRAVLEQEDSGLRLVAIDTATGTEVPQGEDDDHFGISNTIWAIGPVQGVERRLSSDNNTKEVAGEGPRVSNMVLLRDVQPIVTTDEIRELFQQQVKDCPAILSINADVANCWYVFLLSSSLVSTSCMTDASTRGQSLILPFSSFSPHRRVALDTTDRDAMLRVVLQLRTLTLGGDHVHARLKTSTAHQAPTVHPLADAVARVAAAAAPLANKKKARSRCRKKRTGAKSKGTGQVNSGKNNTDQTAPSFAEGDFPTLVKDTVVWAAPLVEDVDELKKCDDPIKANKTHSDTASTATSTSSSMESGKLLAGYAAAVLGSSEQEPPRLAVAPRAVDAKDFSQAETAAAEADPVVIAPPEWGKGRSFADAARSG